MATRLPLAGIRVLELGQLVAGPSATRILGDFGAEVIKIEPPEGDALRQWGEVGPSGWSWWWSMQARNKRLVAIDLKQPEGQDLVRGLAAQADVLVQNLRPGLLRRWGLDYQDLQAVNPSLIYASISGYGLTGPYSDRPGFGNIAESMGGIRYVTGFPDGPPVRTGLSLGDELAAFQAAIGILVALYRRSQDPEHMGDHIDAALSEAALALTEGMLPEYLNAGLVQERTGNQLLRAAPSGIYPTRDGKWVAISANSTDTFARLGAAMHRTGLFQELRFATNAGRVRHVDELDACIGQWTGELSLAQVLETLTHAGVPVGPVMNARDIADDPQVRARDMVVFVEDASGVEVGMLGVVPKLTRSPGTIRWAGGSVGADTEAVLAEMLQISGSELARLRTAGVIR